MSTRALRWRQMSESEARMWNERLLETPASFLQYPYWNLALRQMRMRPYFLVYERHSDALAYACLIRFMLSPVRFGLIQRGPVFLTASEETNRAAVADLIRWARKRRFIFLRFTHPDASWLDSLSTRFDTRREESFPFYRDLSHELLVAQKHSDAEMLKSFQKVARQEIRKAQNGSCRIEVRSADSFAETWPLFERLSKRKGFCFRPLASYLTLLKEAEAAGCACVYVATMRGRAVAAAVVVRDRDSAAYMSGALDPELLAEQTSPACLLQWRAMRDSYALGIQTYNLGTRSGPVHQFKHKFRPVERVMPVPAVVVLRPIQYAIWQRGVVRMLVPLAPTLKTLLFKAFGVPAEHQG